MFSDIVRSFYEWYDRMFVYDGTWRKFIVVVKDIWRYFMADFNVLVKTF